MGLDQLFSYSDPQCVSSFMTRLMHHFIRVIRVSAEQYVVDLTTLDPDYLV